MLCKTKRFLKSSTFIFFLLSFGSSILNYLFQIYMGKRMLVSDYGSFNSINSFCANLSCFFLPISVYLCRGLAGKGGNPEKAKNELADASVLTILISAVITIGLIVLFGFGYAERFGTKNSIEVYIVLIILTAGFISIISGFLQGTNRFVMLGMMTFIMVIIKFIIAVTALVAGSNVLVPVISILVSNILAIIIAIWFLYVYLKNYSFKINIKSTQTFKGFGTIYGLTFMINAIISPYINGGEIVIMSGKYNMKDVGTYSLAITIARASVFLITIFTNIMLPRLAKAKTVGRNIKILYFQSIGICLAIGVTWLLFVRTIGIYIVLYLLGEDYYNALLNLKYMALWVVNLGVLIMINTYYLAINKLRNYLAVLASVSVFTYLILKLCNIRFWSVPIVLGIATAIIISWSLLDVLVEGRKETIGG